MTINNLITNCQPYLSTRPNITLAAGVISGSKTDTCILTGENTSANSNYSIESEPSYEIASITKTFTATLLAQVSLKTATNLNDPIKKFLPATETFSDSRTGEITLSQLATHSSGLPRLPDNFQFADPDDPYLHFTTSYLLDALAQTSLKTTPGTKYEYSNFGYSLLGYILEQITESSFSDLIKNQILKPLKMTRSTVSDSTQNANRDNLIQGFNESHEPVPPWNFHASAAAGAIIAPVSDMIKYLEACIHMNNSSLTDAFQITQTTHFPDPPYAVGLGWDIATKKSGKIHFHNGGTGGYSSFIAFNRSSERGVVLLSNYAHNITDKISLDSIGMSALEP